MPEKQNFDNMTTEELENFLRMDAEAPDGVESDTEELLYVMEVLADRRRKNGHTGKTALEAYESFKQNYMPEVEDAVKTPDNKVSRKARSPRWIRGLSAAAAVLVIIFLSSLTASAFGINVWDTVAKWTQDMFYFGGSNRPNESEDPDPNDDMRNESLIEVLKEAGIDESLVPTKIPEGYQLTGISVEKTPLQNIYVAQYKNGQNEIKISVRDYLDIAPVYSEKNDGCIDVYETAGNTFYIFTNNTRQKAVWINGMYECSIFGDVTIEELKMMIDSIKEG